MAILAFDIGTSSVKTLLVEENGTIIDSAAKGYQTCSPQQTWAQQDAHLWFTCAVDTAQRLFSRNEARRGDISVIGVCGHMLGLLPVDSAGEPLHPCLIHADARAELESEHILNNIGDRQALYARTGSVLSAQSPLCKALWLKRNRPDIYSRTARFLQSKDYLVSRLTGNIDATDFSDASHAVYIDIHKKEYLYDVFSELGLGAEKFPTIHKGTDIVGTLVPAAATALGLRAGIPVIAGGGDGACAGIGAGISARKGNAYVNLGTTAWISAEAQMPIIDPKVRLFNIMSLDGERFGLFGTMQTAGKCVAWLQNLLSMSDMAEFESEAGAVAPGCDGLLFLPYLEGERAPIFDSNARGIFFGMHSAHTRAHFCRAALEGVAYALHSILDVFRETHALSEMRVIGGGADNELWKRMIADICGINLVTGLHADSTTSLGVALAAAVGIGVHRTLDDAVQCVATSSCIVPDASNRGVYDAMFDKYMRLYPRVKDLF